eukprot:TRINITY_DN15932_c0_g1_i1.p1 TRINITY_DN15932_c0_g1~~TRINITY_DN15932_c0_g1_i1.p1  ORF type:complete len:201 (+),score=21.14 TRINITY_DN15932_c0_g1_i1:70-672(+)
MARPQSTTFFQDTSLGRIGLSDAAEQRWHRLTGGAHLLGNLYQPQQHDNMFRLTPSVQQSVGASSGQDLHQREGATIALAYPTHELLEQTAQDHESSPLPNSPERRIDAPTFVPPDGEEWHMLHGFLVRMSRAERDRLLARAEESDSEDEEEDGIDSEADTSVGSGSVSDLEASERAQDSTSNEVETWGDEHIARQVVED